MSLGVARGLVFARFVLTGVGCRAAAGEADVLRGVFGALTVIQLLVMARHLLDKIRFHRTKTIKRNTTTNHPVHLKDDCSTDDVDLYDYLAMLRGTLHAPGEQQPDVISPVHLIGY